MFEVRYEDVKYAENEVLLQPVPQFGGYEWEAELERHSAGFFALLALELDTVWNVMMEHACMLYPKSSRADIQRKAEIEAQSVRKLLTVVFATVYSACDNMLPDLSLEKTMAVLKLYVEAEAFTLLEEDVLRTMSGLLPRWGETFRNMVNATSLLIFSRCILFALLKSLLDELPHDMKGSSGWTVQ